MTASRSTRQHFTWGDVCDGWRLVDGPDLTVIEEHIPPGAGESWHWHDQAHQVLFVLTGTARVDRQDQPSVDLHAGEAIDLPSGRAHRFANAHGMSDLRVLIISAPASKGDRHEWRSPN